MQKGKIIPLEKRQININRMKYQKLKKCWTIQLINYLNFKQKMC